MSQLTVRQLAAMAGCSHVTVSLALRNHPRISAATRERILRLAQESGYSRDPLVSSLMNQLRTSKRNRPAEKIAYLTWWDAPDAWRKAPNDTSGYTGACERARELGYEIEEIWAKAPGLSGRRLTKILHTRSIRALIVGSLPRPKGHVSLNWDHFAPVAIGHTVVKPDLHRVSHSHFQGMMVALRSLKHRGYARVGFTSLADQSERVNEGWLAGYLMHQYGLPAGRRVPPLLAAAWDRKKFLQWIEKHRPDAVVSNMADPLEILQKAGYRIPEDIGYASLDRIQMDAPFAGIDQMRRQIGAAAVEMAVAHVESNKYGLPTHPKIINFDGAWMDGPTVRSAGSRR
jgi:DNA-binding LacI/PurR family transcriptional regulator